MKVRSCDVCGHEQSEVIPEVEKSIGDAEKLNNVILVAAVLLIAVVIYFICFVVKKFKN